MRILFVVSMHPIPPLGIMVLSAALKSHGHLVDVVESDVKAIIKRLRSYSDEPVMVAYSIMTFEAAFYIDLNKRLQAAHPVFALFGGPHPTFFPDMIKEEGVSAICRGEGQEAVVDLADALETGKPLTAIPNLWVKKDGEIYRNELRPPVRDLDSLLFADRTLFTQRSFVHRIMVSRGCPFRCTYCFNHAYNALYDNKTASICVRSVKNAIEELQHIKTAGLLQSSWIMFQDSIFVTDQAWINEFRDAYKRHIGLSFSVNQRPELINKEWIDVLKDAGCFEIRMGVESGDSRVRKDIMKRFMDDEQIIRAAQMIKSAGLKLRTYNILGIPGGTFESDMRTLLLNIACKPDHVTVSLMQPYPGTELYDFARSNGKLELQGDVLAGVPSTERFSQVIFSSPEEKNMTENLHKFFAFTVRFPCVLPVVKKLIRLPNNRIYLLFFLIFAIFDRYISLAPLRWRAVLSNVLMNIPRGLRHMWGILRRT